MLLLDDRIVYQSIADLLAPHFAPEECVYSNLLSRNINSSRMFQYPVDLWLRFQNEVARQCGEYPYVVETDIAAYFDHVSHHLLLSRIEDLFRDDFPREILRGVKQLLERMWRRWSREWYRFGIPQMNDASAFFGNLYLDELDKRMCRRGHEFLRYVDDMRIFAEDEPTARKALAHLIVELRKMGLYVASKKTAIRKTETVLTELEEGRQRMDSIEENLKSGDPERIDVAVGQLDEFFSELVSDPERFNDRHFRFCVHRFRRLKVSGLGGDTQARVRDEVLARLERMPESTDVFVDYLSQFPEDDRVQDSVLEFVEGRYNIYPWQEMQLLELLIRSDLERDLLQRVISVARACSDESKHPACRAKALVLWGKTGDYADRREIRSLYYDEVRPDVRRAILVAIQEMQVGERDNFYRVDTTGRGAEKLTAEYIRSLSEPKYHYYQPPPGFELRELYDDSDDLDDLGDEHLLY